MTKGASEGWAPSSKSAGSRPKFCQDARHAATWGWNAEGSVAASVVGA
ncbi:hypothetical protein [Corynebacterium phoceense]|nr:hypothetical protein [Corynebacterium phoceense]